MNPRTRYVRLAGLLLAFAALVNSAASQQIAQQAYLKASNTGADDEFGQSVAVSGDTMVVGAPFESSNATGVNGNQNNNSSSWAGAAYVFVRNGSNWIQQAYLKASNPGATDNFGYPVAVSGDTIVVGAVGESSSATGLDGDQSDNSALGSGAAYVFVRSGTNWIQQAYLKASNTKAGDQFGSSVAVSGDTLVVGAYFEDSSATGVDGDQSDTSAPNSGAAYVFVRNGTSWTQQAYLKASNTDAVDQFGNSVAVADDTVVVGARAEDSITTGMDGDQNDNSANQAGAAYVFVRHGTTWTQQAYLKASATGAGEYFGESVSVAGDIVVVGKAGGFAFAAYVFVRSGAIWTQQAYLKASDTAGNDYFGISVAVSGDTVVVGAKSESSNATGVNGNQTNTNAPYSGAACVFASWDELEPTDLS